MAFSRQGAFRFHKLPSQSLNRLISTGKFSVFTTYETYLKQYQN